MLFLQVFTIQFFIEHILDWFVVFWLALLCLILVLFIYANANDKSEIGIKCHYFFLIKILYGAVDRVRVQYYRQLNDVIFHLRPFRMSNSSNANFALQLKAFEEMKKHANPKIIPTF